MSPLLVMGCRIESSAWPYGHLRSKESLSCHAWCGTRPWFYSVIRKLVPYSYLKLQQAKGTENLFLPSSPIETTVWVLATF
jgi:hypothetical protein